MPENDYTTNIYAVVKEKYGDKFTITPEQFKEKMQDDNYSKNIYAVVKEKYGYKFTKTPEEFKAQFVSAPPDTTPIPTVKLDKVQLQNPDIKPIPKEDADAMMNAFVKMPKDLVNNPKNRNIFYNTYALKRGLEPAVVKQYGERALADMRLFEADLKVNNGEDSPEMQRYIAKVHRSVGDVDKANEAEKLSYEMQANQPVGGGNFQDDGYKPTSYGFSGKNGFTLEKDDKGNIVPVASNQPTEASDYLNGIAQVVEDIGTAGVLKYSIKPAAGMMGEAAKMADDASKMIATGKQAEGYLHEMMALGTFVIGAMSVTGTGALRMAGFNAANIHAPEQAKYLMPLSTFADTFESEMRKVDPKAEVSTWIKDLATVGDLVLLGAAHGGLKAALEKAPGDAKFKRGTPIDEKYAAKLAKQMAALPKEELDAILNQAQENAIKRSETAKQLNPEQQGNDSFATAGDDLHNQLDVANQAAQFTERAQGLQEELLTAPVEPYKPAEQPQVLKNLEPSQPVVMNGKDGILKMNPQGEWQFQSSEGGEPVTVKAKPTKEGEPAQTLADMGISIPHIMSEWQATAEMSLADFIGETKVDGKDVTVVQGKGGDHVLRKLPSGEYEAMFETRTPENERQLKKLKLDAINQAREAEGLEPKSRLNEDYAKEPEPTPEPPKPEPTIKPNDSATTNPSNSITSNVVEVENTGGKPFNGTEISTLKSPYEVNSKGEVEIVDKKRAMASINGSLPRMYEWKEYPNDPFSTITVVKKPIISFDKNGEAIVEQKGEIVFDAELKEPTPTPEEPISVSNDNNQPNGKESQNQGGEKAQENVLTPNEPIPAEPVSSQGDGSLPPTDTPVVDTSSKPEGDIASIRVADQKSARPELNGLNRDEVFEEVKKDVPRAVENAKNIIHRVNHTDGVKVLTTQEVAEMVVYKVDLNNKMNDLVDQQLKRISELRAEGKDEKTIKLGFDEELNKISKDIFELDRQDFEFEQAAYITGYEQSAAFAARQLLADSKYKLVNQVNKWKTEFKKDLPADVQAKYEEAAKKVKDLTREIEADKKSRSEEIKKGILEAIGKAAKKGESKTKEGSLTEEQLQAKKERQVRKEQLKNEILHDIGKSGLNSLLNPDKLLNKKVLEYAKLAVEDAANDFRKFSKDMIDAFGKEIKDYLKKAYQEAGGTGDIYKIEVKDDRLKLPQQLIRDLYNEGADTPAKMTEAIRAEIPEGLEVTTDMIENAWSDYGREISKTKSDLQQDINSLKEIKRLEKKLAEAEKGVLTNKNKAEYAATVTKRVVAGQEPISEKDFFAEKKKQNEEAIKALKESIKEEMRNNPAYEGDRVDSKIESLQERIEEIDRKIAEEEFAEKQKNPSTNPEVIKLEKELEERQKKFQELKDKANGKEKVILSEHEKRVKSLEDSIAETEKQLKENKFPANTPKPKVTDAEIKALEDKLADLNKQKSDAKKKLAGQPVTEIEKRTKSLEDSIKQVEDDLKNKNFAKSQPKSQPSNVKTRQLESKLKGLRDDLSKERQKFRGTQPLTPEQKQIRIEQRAIDNLKDKIKNKKYVPSAKKTPLSTPIVDKLRAQKEALKKQFEAEKKSASQNLQANPEVRRLQSIDTSIKRVQERIAKGQFEPKPRPEPPTSKAIRDKELELFNAKHVFETERLKERYKNQGFQEKAIDVFVDLMNTTRAVQAGFDMSAPLRQGGMYFYAHPVRWLQSYRDMWKDAASQKSYEKFLQDLMTDPKYAELRKAGLELSKLNAKETAKEEMSRGQMLYRIQEGEEYIIKKISQGKFDKHSVVSNLPVRLFKGTNRGYSGFLNRLRVAVFTDRLKAMKEAGITDPKAVAAWAKIVNAATGRGNIKLGEGAIDTLSQLAFYSIRFQASRVENILRPYFGKDIPSWLRVRIIKDQVLAGAGILSTVYTLKYLLQQAGLNPTVETNPRSTDYMQLRVGDKRWDFTFGQSAWVKLAAQLWSGEKKEVDTQTIEEASNTLGKFVRSKTSPVTGSVINAAYGKDFLGNPTDWKQELKTFFKPPMTIDMLREQSGKQSPSAMAALFVPAFFGVSDNAYEKPISQQVGMIDSSSGDDKVTKLAKLYVMNDPDKKTELMKTLATEGVNLSDEDFNKITVELQSKFSQGEAQSLSDKMKEEYTSNLLDSDVSDAKKQAKQIAKEDEHIQQMLHPDIGKIVLDGSENYKAITDRLLKADKNWVWEKGDNFDTRLKKALEEAGKSEWYDKYYKAYLQSTHQEIAK